MLENQQAGNNQSKNVNNTTTEQSCVGTTSAESTDKGTWGSNREDRSPSSTGESGTSGGKSGSQPESHRQNSSMNPALSRALIGGLIGGTLGSLAGALAGKRMGEGFNHTMKGMGEAAKTIGEGLGHTVRGLGDVAKSVAEGASYAVIGDGLDAAQSAAEGVKEGAVGTINALQKTSRDVNAAVQETAERTKEAAENSLGSENGGKQDRQPTQNQDVGMGQRETTHSIYISSPENTAGYVGEPTAFVNEEISVEIFEDSSLQEEINRIDS